MTEGFATYHLLTRGFATYHLLAEGDLIAFPSLNRMVCFFPLLTKDCYTVNKG
jgi:hypothetical protein